MCVCVCISSDMKREGRMKYDRLYGGEGCGVKEELKEITIKAMIE